MNKRHGFTMVELLVVVFLIAMVILLMLPVLDRAAEGPRREACADNMRQIGMALKMYSLDNKHGMYPPMLGKVAATRDCSVKGAPLTGKTQSFVAPIFDTSLLYPNYLSDLTLLVCPSNKGHDKGAMKKNRAGNIPATLPCASGPNWTNAGDSYTYFGWMLDRVSDAADETMLVSTYLKQVPTTLDPNGCPGMPNTAFLAIQPTALYLNRMAKFRALEKTSPGLANRVWDEDANLASTKHLKINWMPLSRAGGKVWVGTMEEETIYRLQKGIEAKYFVPEYYSGTTRAASEIEILWDKVPANVQNFRHYPAGVSILYLDGHVAFEKYPQFAYIQSESFANFMGCVID